MKADRQWFCWLLTLAVLTGCSTVAPSSQPIAQPSSRPTAHSNKTDTSIRTPTQESARESGLPGEQRNTQAERRQTEDTQETPSKKPVQQSTVIGQVGRVTDTGLREISGLASSTRSAGTGTDGTLWAINDSGNEPLLFAIAPDGSVKARFRLPVRNRDWESLSAFRYKGESWLMIADTGDNLETHGSYYLHFIKEPILSLPEISPEASPETAPDSSQSSSTSDVIRTITDSHSLTFDYAPLPESFTATQHHNVEAVGVSTAQGLVYFVTRHATRALVFSLALQDALTAAVSHDAQEVTANRRLTADFQGVLTKLNQHPIDRLAGTVIGVELSQATGLEFSPSGHYAYVLTYRGVHRFLITPATRTSWFEQPPVRIVRHTLRQSEAIAIQWDDAATDAASDSRDVLFFTSEKLPAPVMKLLFVHSPS